MIAGGSGSSGKEYAQNILYEILRRFFGGGAEKVLIYLFFYFWKSITEKSHNISVNKIQSKNHGGMQLIGLLPLACSAKFCICTGLNCPRMVPLTACWAFLHPLSSRKGPQNIPLDQSDTGNSFIYILFIENGFSHTVHLNHSSPSFLCSSHSLLSSP